MTCEIPECIYLVHVQLNSIYAALENLLDKDAAERKWNNRTRIGFAQE